MAARITGGNASAGESTWATDTSYQNKCTFAKTPSANSTVLVFYSALIANSSTSYLTSVRLRNSTSATTLCEAVFNPRDTTDYVCVSGFAIETYGASPASQTYDLDFATSNVGGTAAIKNAEIWYLELDATDFTAIGDGPHTVTDTNFVTGVTMTQTFANGVDYYILAMAEPSTTSTSPIPTIEAFYDGATSYGTMAHDFGNTAEFGSWTTQFKITGAGTSKDIIIRCKSSSTIDVSFRKARLVALRADKFEASFYDEDRTRTTNATTTYTDKVTSTHTLAAVEHIIIGGGILDCPSVTQSALMQLIEDAASLGEHIHEANTASETGGASCYNRGYRKTFAAGSVTLKTQWKAETSVAMGLKESSILILQTGAATGIAFDAASNSGYQAAQSSYSWSHTCTGSDRYLVVGIAMLSLAQSVTSITYNSVALRLLGIQASISGAARVELWGLEAPTTGSNTIAVTLSGSIASAGLASSYTGVHQTSATEAFNSAQATNVGAADATVNITTVADNDWCVDIVATDDAAITVGAGQTQRGNVTGAGGSGAMSSEGPKTPAGAVAMSWTDVAALATWAIGGVALRPVAAVNIGFVPKVIMF